MNVLVSLDGIVQGQGIKVSARDWLDMGSEGWAKTPEAVKAAAYQAALVAGWKDSGLIKIMTNCWGPRIELHDAEFTLEILKDLVTKYPCDTEEVYKVDVPKPVYKIKNSDQTVPFPIGENHELTNP